MTTLAYAAIGAVAGLLIEFAAAWAIALTVLLALVVLAVLWPHATREPEHVEHHHVRVLSKPFDWEEEA